MKKSLKGMLLAASLGTALVFAGCANVSDGSSKSNDKTDPVTPPSDIDPSPVSSADDSMVMIKCAQGFTGTVKCLRENTEVASKKVLSDSVCFYGLDNDVEYTFEVSNTSGSKSTTVKATPSITKKKSDYLMVMYIDGDNNLNDYLYLDLNETEYGLSKIRNEDGSAKDGYASVNVVALWDGWVGQDAYTDKNGKYHEAEYPTIGNTGSFILELGPDSNGFTKDDINAESIKALPKECYTLSASTKNLSYAARDLLGISEAEGTLSQSDCGEVDMGDGNTLTDLLNWVNERYEADHVIIQFSDHGGGPRSVTSSKHTLKASSPRRALCWDEGSDGSFLTSEELGDALKNAGYEGDNKADLLLMDVCLGASIEDSYQFKDAAKYMVASPANIPGFGFDYVSLMQNFTSGTDIVELGKGIVNDYRAFYDDDLETWTALIEEYMQEYPEDFEGVSIEDALREVNWSDEVSTLSLIDLSQSSAVAEKIDEFAKQLLEVLDEKITINGYEVPLYYYIRLAYLTSGYYCISYSGTYNGLFDVGYFADCILSSDKFSSYTSLVSSAKAVKESIPLMIKAAFRDNVYTSCDEKDFYTGTLGSDTLNYGLTIAGPLYYEDEDEDGNESEYYCYPTFYGTDLSFGRENSWNDFYKEICDYESTY